MFTGESLIGRRVLARQEGQMLDSVKDIVIDTTQRRVVALLIDEGRLFSAPTVVPLEKVVSIGSDVVVVSDTASAVAVNQYPMVKEILDRDDRLVGKAVYTEEGSAFGKVVDVSFELPNGNVTEINVASGSDEDRPVINVNVSVGDVISIGKDAVVISPSAGASRDVAQSTAGTAPSPRADAPQTSALPDATDTGAWDARRATGEARPDGGVETDGGTGTPV